jgi:hypothetical protein
MEGILSVTECYWFAALVRIRNVQGSWVFQTKWWLPVHLITFLLVVLGSTRHQV